MDREQIYAEWLNTTIIGQGGKTEPLCSKGTLKEFEKICDDNFFFYSSYQSYYISTKKDGNSSIKGIRSKLLHFLLSKEIANNSLEYLTDSTLDSYFMTIYNSNSERKRTFISRINYVSGFLKYLFSQNLIPSKFDYNKYRNLKFDEETPSDNLKRALTARQISEFYHYYSDNSEYLYVFEMKYYTEFNDKQIQHLSIDNIDIPNRIITIDGKSQKVPDSIIRNILELHSQKKLNNLLNITQYIRNLKPFFERIGFKNFKAKDITLETKEKLFFRCPQCGKSFEAIVDNWCAVQYVKNGKMWIICRECGNA